MMAPRTLPLAGAILFVVAFQVVYYLQTLYNSAPRPEQRIDRLVVLEESPALLKDACRRLSDLENLADRKMSFAGAAFLLASAVWVGLSLQVWLIPSERLPPWERVLYAAGFGIGAYSLIVQFLGLAGILHRTSLVLIPAVAVVVRRLAPRGSARRETPPADSADDGLGPSAKVLLVLAMLPFAALATLAAALPTTDYDALAYHLLGPKEYFLAGRIEFLPHNVYTTFPFLTEMYPLAGMALLGDWFEGGLAGQIALSASGPATAAACGMLARRTFGPAAGWTAAFLYLTTPWTYRLSSIPYVEGMMLFFAVLAVDAAWKCAESPLRSGIAAGGFAGCAIACKYPGLVVVAVPAMAILLVRARPASRWTSLLGFAAGCAAMAGPWLIRNFVWTGNPTFPLLFSLFGGREWSSGLAQRFARGHQPSGFGLQQAAGYLWDVLARSDWQSGLVFAFAPLAFLTDRKRTAATFTLFMAYLFLAYWLLTHRLDRFWLPIEPFAAVLAGAGATWTSKKLWRTTVFLAAAIYWVYALAYCTSGLCGLANYTAPLRDQRLENIRAQSPAVAVANDQALVPRGDRVLFLGYAGVYESQPEALYSTVFNQNRFETMLADPENPGRSKTPTEVRAALAKAGIDRIIVDWSWVDRYRAPGNYGYSESVRPEVFAELVRAGVLTKIPTGRPFIELYRVESAGERE